MMNVQQSNQYFGFGLKIKSEMPLPELTYMESTSMDHQIDVQIKFADLSDLWEEWYVPSQRFVVNDKLIMFKISSVGIFCIENGASVLVSPAKNAEVDRLRLYILGTCMGIILIQRKIFALHGSAVEMNGKAYAFIGDSGAGKSTLAAEFLSRGFKLLSDDVVPIVFTTNQIPYVIPGYPQQKLWLQSLEEFGMNPSLYRPLIERGSKFTVPTHDQFSIKPIPLGGIFELQIEDGINQTHLSPIENLDCFQTLYYHTYRNFIVDRLGLMDWHFNTVVNLIKNSKLYRLKRPTGSFTTNQLAMTILDTLQLEEKTYEASVKSSSSSR